MCGLGFVADLRRPASHEVVGMGLEMLRRLSHRGAAGQDPRTSDGAGIMIDIPHARFERELAHGFSGSDGIEIPNAGDYGVAQCFLSRDPRVMAAEMRILEAAVRDHDQRPIVWRDVPVDTHVLGPIARASMPVMKQLFIARMTEASAFERTLFMIRKRAARIAIEQKLDRYYTASMSSRTIVYKGLSLPEKLGAFYVDLAQAETRSRFALVHSRFSTNTFPTWERAHPYRLVAHNGEINTLKGNQCWMRAREPLLASDAFGVHLQDFKPIIRPGGSDSASLDNVVDFLVAGGRSLPHVMMMMVPEAYEGRSGLSDARRAFYEYHASIVEPWDGPAAIAFSDGRVVGAALDRSGLRPASYVITTNGLVVCASELGVLDIDPGDVVEKGRVRPGRMLLVDLAEHRVVREDEIEKKVCYGSYQSWLDEHVTHLADLPARPKPEVHDVEQLLPRFGYSREDFHVILEPMAETGEEPTGSMGNDTPLAVLSDRPQLLSRYFKQQFAQVTNPPLDPIREKLVMSLTTQLGGKVNLLSTALRTERVIELDTPILSPSDVAKLGAAVVSMTFDGDLETALERLCVAANRAVDEGASVIVLSDRGGMPIPSVLATSAVHHALVRSGKRMRVGLVVESGEARETADVALLIGYGASAVCPWLAMEALAARGLDIGRYANALAKGLLKVMSKMGISCVSSYHGAQVFEAIGIGHDVIDRFFPGTPSALGGIGLPEIEAETKARWHSKEVDIGGVYAWRVGGERHLWGPRTIASLQKAVRLEDARSYEEYAKLVNDQNDHPFTLRGLWDFVWAAAPIPLDEVEPAASIVRRFATGAMSFGSISKEAHENLARAMNRIGGKSNSGEGGEDPARLGTDRRSAIKQVASARFGVTAQYLVDADELQIKIAQGAKPGEGGQLPGHKVDAAIARVRHSVPGVTLISPPPHHDIYSIEDLAQLIFDLKRVNPRARLSVKLVSETGVGTIAAGVIKAGADAVHIAGHDGGTGASPLSSIQHAGTAWELGLSETQQVLLQNGLRERAVIQADGQIKTGRDVAFAALLGADEFGFATAPLVASGCVMMRKCHLNTCPVGIATQDPVLRQRFAGHPEHVINYFFFVAEELRQIMARLGFRRVADMVGRCDRIRVRETSHPKARLLDFAPLLHRPMPKAMIEDPGADPIDIFGSKDEALVDAARLSLRFREKTSVRVKLANYDRSFGARLAGEIARHPELRDGSITVHAIGTAGQSFGAFAGKGMLLLLEGDANDYVGKGLSGGTLALRPNARAKFRACDQLIAGNTCLYGATSGRAFFAGRAGERFAVRNGGATAIVEGVGDHGCEYMTGGVVVVLGSVGHNFGAGMSGGVAFVHADDGLASRVNPAMVDLEPLAIEDESLVRELIEEHVRLTGSARGKAILDKWIAQKFVKVMPREYRRVLGTRQKAAG